MGPRLSSFAYTTQSGIAGGVRQSDVASCWMLDPLDPQKCFKFTINSIVKSGMAGIRRQGAVTEKVTAEHAREIDITE